MKNTRIGFAANCMEIAGYIQFPCAFLLGLVLVSNGAHSLVALTGFLLGIGLATASVLAGRWLRHGRSRRWIASLMLCTVYLFSLFLPLGALGLWALLSASTRAQFFKSNEPPPELPMA
ncbi:hypothetical protein [Xylophilus ampelinus]|uniref:hypothetical protein n=1 Tax=Xylophilus ampelinus TaxID=54067 RepID=UPI0011B7A0E9|nr:hypothetical protein [Xylophilus ampelinus]MCS4509528.1 hypothetical protein [Xylophilus ampelinus]